MSHIDQKVSKVLTDTETLLDQFRKKVADIYKNKDNIKRFKEDISQTIKKIETKLDHLDKNCEEHHNDTNDHIDRIALKFKEDLIDYQATCEGFARELERVQILFREL